MLVPATCFGMIERLDYASFFAYTPILKFDDAKHAKDATMALKREEARPNGICQSQHLVSLMSQKLENYNFDFFKNKPVLVPVPKSSPIRTGDLWVPQRIAKNMVQEGLGRAVQPCLKRCTAVLKSAYSHPSDRPDARKHYNSFSVEALTDVDDLVL